jgi:hypothetical protein
MLTPDCFPRAGEPRTLYAFAFRGQDAVTSGKCPPGHGKPRHAEMAGYRRRFAGLRRRERVLAPKLDVQLADAVDGDGNGVDRIVHHADADRCAAAVLEVEQSIVDDFLHDKERSGLAHSRQCNELLSMKPIEVRHIAHPNFQEVVEVAGDEMAVQNERQLPYRRLECREALGRGSIENDTDHNKSAARDAVRRNFSSDRADVAFLEEALRTPVAGRGTHVGLLCQLGVGSAPIPLQELQNSPVRPVQGDRFGGFFHIPGHLGFVVRIQPRFMVKPLKCYAWFESTLRALCGIIPCQ